MFPYVSMALVGDGTGGSGAATHARGDAAPSASARTPDAVTKAASAKAAMRSAVPLISVLRGLGRRAAVAAELRAGREWVVAVLAGLRLHRLPAVVAELRTR